MKRTAYFGMMSAALEEAGIHRPALVIDLERLNANLSILREAMRGGPAIRLVDKSLPALPLLAHAMRILGTRKIMSFHLPVTLAVLAEFPDVHALFGKPMPIAAVTQAFAHAGRDQAGALAGRVTWLIDSEVRLGQYASFARSLGTPLRIAFEINIGMQRGGFETPADLASAVRAASSEPLLLCEGVMGYEAHVPAIPALFGGPKAALIQARARFSEFVAALPPGQRAILNTGGSQTAFSHSDNMVANEVSIGSALVKPTDFDRPGLGALAPAIFIATPVLKVLKTRLPGPRPMSALFQALGLFPRNGCFLYGGKFMARPVYPPGLKRNRIWGDSSNQQLMAFSTSHPVAPDDLVFFRPTQSEAVLQQFGPLQIMENGRITTTWPVLPAG